MTTLNIIDNIKTEVTSRIIAQIFLTLRDIGIPAPTMSYIKENVGKAVFEQPLTEGTSFALICQQLSVFWDGSKPAEVNVDEAIKKTPHLRFQLMEIAKALSPIVLQTIRHLDTAQAHAEDILFKLHEEITKRLSTDVSLKNYNITPLHLGVLEDADALETASLVAEQRLPDMDIPYGAGEYSHFSMVDNAYNRLSDDEIAELNKFLLDESVFTEELSRLLSYEPNERLFLKEVASPKTYTDFLTNLWDKVVYLKRVISELPEDNAIKYSRIADNVNKLYTRVAMAIYWARILIERSYKKQAISSFDDDNIYVYPWATAAVTAAGSKSPEEDINLFVKAAVINKLANNDGWSASDVVLNNDANKRVIAAYTESLVNRQERDTALIIRDVCGTMLKDFGQDTVITLYKDLIHNDTSALQDLVNAIIERSKDFYLNALNSATNNLVMSDIEPDKVKGAVILQFLITVAIHKIITPVK